MPDTDATAPTRPRIIDIGEEIGYDRPPGIIERIERIGQRTCEVDELLHRLIQALDPVMFPESPDAVALARAVAAGGPPSQVASLLDVHEDRLAHISGLLAATYDRLNI